MAVSHGKNGKIKISTNAVADTTKWSLNETVDTADSTAQGDTAMTHLVGIPGWSAEVEGNYDPADTNGQVVLAIGSSVTVKFYHDGDASGAKYKTGTATVTSRKIDSDKGDVNKFSVSLSGNGALTEATES